MLLVAIPLSQRTRSEPVTRIHPTLWMGAKAAEVRIGERLIGKGVRKSAYT